MNALHSQSRDLSHPWLILFLSSLFFDIFVIISENLLLVYTNTVGFCMLILSAILVNSLIRSNSFLVEFLAFLIYKIMASTSRGNFNLFLFNFDTFSSFWGGGDVIAPARTSSTTIEVMRVDTLVVLFLIFKEKLSTFHH